MSETTVETAAEALTYIDAGDRDTWVRMAMALKSEFGDGAFDVWDDWSQTDKRYDKQAAKDVWRSVRPGKVGLGSLIHLAKEEGFELKPDELTPEEKARRVQQAQARRREREAQAAREEAERAEWHGRVAAAAEEVWNTLVQPTGVSPYLGVKRIKPLGARFVGASVVVVTDQERQAVELITGGERIKAFFDGADALDRERVGFKYLKRGTLVVPLRDAQGALWNLQLIFPSGKKSFLKFGRKQGCFHLIEGITPGVTMAAEGYATAASLHLATGYRVAVAFDAGNLLPVARALRALYPDDELVIAGDDDRADDKNPGRTKATAAAQAVGARVLFPEFRGAA